MKDIKENIKERTEKIIERILDRAKKISQKEFSLAKKKKEQILLERKDNIEKMLEAERVSKKAQLFLEFRLKEENFKDRLSESLLKEAREDLRGLNEENRLACLKNLILEAILNLELKEAYILVNKNDEDILKKNYNDVLGFLRERVKDFKILDIRGSLNCLGGTVIKAANTGEFFDNTFEKRFERFAEEFKQRILEEIT